MYRDDFMINCAKCDVGKEPNNDKTACGKKGEGDEGSGTKTQKYEGWKNLFAHCAPTGTYDENRSRIMSTSNFSFSNFLSGTKQQYHSTHSTGHSPEAPWNRSYHQM